MIGQLTGKLLIKQPPLFMIDVNGVGYELQASMQCFYQLPELGQTLTLPTHLVVREDAQTLYGFCDQTEKRLFQTLIKVSGVGPKLAITILSGIAPDAFVQCILLQDSAQLVKLPGVGKKKADRLILEMRDRLEDWHSDLTVAASQDLPASVNQILQEAISALVALGYKPQEASRVVSRVEANGKTCEDIIREALKGEVA